MHEGGTSRHAAEAGIRRIYAAWRAQPTWLHRIGSIVIILLLLGAAGILILWGVILAAVIAVIAAIIVGVRAIWMMMNGPEPLRRNVRIIRRP